MGTWLSTPAKSSAGDVNDNQKISCVQGEVWINELHYDNAGTDKNEFIEIGCNQEVDVTGYKLVLYNGSDRKEYNTASLSGVCSPLTNFVVQNYSIIQNGGSDGIALVNESNESNEVVEFISYKGSLEAL